MSVRYITLNCPSCGVSVGENQKNCPSCGVPLVFAMDNSGTSIVQIKTLIKLSRYSDAIQKCNEFLSCGIETADIYYYLCISLLEGKKPFSHNRDRIDACVDAIECATRMSEESKFYLLRAYIEYDYFERKYLNRNPNYRFFVEKVIANPISCDERNLLEKMLNNKINVKGLV